MINTRSNPKQWLAVKEQGLYCRPGDFFIDPVFPVNRAVITHAHGDHARSGHQHIYATHETVEIMKIRYGEDCAGSFHSLNYYEPITINKVDCYLLPAGHILGSAQLVMSFDGVRVIVSGDYKRAADPTCPPFVVEPCDIFITEATFALPVFKHPPIEQEMNKVLTSLNSFPERCHLIGVYGLGKCQRFIKVLRLMGYLDAIYLHGAFDKLCNYYKSKGIDLGDLQKASSLNLKSSQGKIVLCPPGALHDRWSRRFANVLVAMASGWMQIRARAKQKGIELPLIISDHADWFELIQTIKEINPKEVWVTHGQEDALLYYLKQQGYQAQALHLLGYEDHED
ncbi:MAG: ligase-associated DNA damage response exonuclease [Tatlockia sp.]|nr:ligase-associated DNA damage response exonuclease [Tatlockia sp.]